MTRLLHLAFLLAQMGQGFGCLDDDDLGDALELPMSCFSCNTTSTLRSLFADYLSKTLSQISLIKTNYKNPACCILEMVDLEAPSSLVKQKKNMVLNLALAAFPPFMYPDPSSSIGWSGIDGRVWGIVAEKMEAVFKIVVCQSFAATIEVVSRVHD